MSIYMLPVHVLKEQCTQMWNSGIIYEDPTKKRKNKLLFTENVSNLFLSLFLFILF